MDVPPVRRSDFRLGGKDNRENYPDHLKPSLPSRYEQSRRTEEGPHLFHPILVKEGLTDDDPPTPLRAEDKDQCSDVVCEESTRHGT